MEAVLSSLAAKKDFRLFFRKDAHFFFQQQMMAMRTDVREFSTREILWKSVPVFIPRHLGAVPLHLS